MSGVSVLVLTLNEELALPGCLRSCQWSDDIVVFDSGSCDRTEQIAREHGARFTTRPFDDYASQRMAALRETSFKHDWVLMLDADERVEPELASEILHAVMTASDSVSMFRVRRRDMMEGRWLRRASGYPTWFGRLVRPGRVRVERPINEEYHANGEVRELTGHLRHFPFAKGLSWWIDRHNRYSDREAALALEERRIPIALGNLVSRDPVVRRGALKCLLRRLPGRPLLVFLGLLVVRGGVLDGRQGVRFCLLKAWYEWLIDLKSREMASGDAEWNWNVNDE